MAKRTLLKAVIAGLTAWAIIIALVLLAENRLIFKPLSGWQDAPANHDLDAAVVAIETPDGETLRGWRFHAPGAAPRHTIVWYHGNAGNASTRLPLATRLVSETGADVLLVDYRTYGRSSGTYIDEDMLYTDALTIFDFAAAQDNPENIVLFGYSLGAAAAVETALRRNPGAVVLGSAFTSVPDMAARSHWYVPFPRLLARTKLDNLSKIGRLRAPLLLFHGGRDEIIPVRHAEALSGSAPPGATVRIFPDAGHRLQDFERERGYWNAWRQHLTELRGIR